MFKTPKKLDSFVGQGWGQKASVKLHNGPTYEEVHLHTNLKPNEFYITVSLNGEDIYKLTGDELVMLESYKNHFVEEGVYVIPFADISAKTKNGVNYTGLVTLPTDNILLDIHITGHASTERQQDPVQISGLAYMGGAQPQRIFVPKFITRTMQAANQGENEYNAQGAINRTVKRMFFKSGLIEEIKVVRDNLQIFECTAKQNAFMQKRFKRIPQKEVFVFDPIVTGFALDNRFMTFYESQLKFTVTTSDIPHTIPILFEEVVQVADVPTA
ncbi:major capsid protein P2 [Algicola sagamiensis]|uniref:major capsid protein P2 n=1 Tax=Algicola sagamiensis TaxID=163869 RepID=UPI000366E214|nr:major capsid protein P2 [Algicola sagamiensis]